MPDAQDARPPFAATADLQTQGLDRRTFLKTSALGVGLVALPNLGFASLFAPGSISPRINTEGLTNWVEPYVFDFYQRQDTDPVVRLTVTKAPAPAWMQTVDPDTQEKTPKTLFTYAYTDLAHTLHTGPGPGPTLIISGDCNLNVHLHNALAGNLGLWAYTNHARFAKEVKFDGYDLFRANTNVPMLVDRFLQCALIYGPHMQHTTNLHTHGLHVAPGENPDGTQSDNVLLRLLPQDTLPECPADLTPSERPNQQHKFFSRNVDYEFRIGNKSVGVGGRPVPTHPPGTHWYHPHPHGATYDQVVAGMAGFLIVKGDVDEKLEGALLANPAYNYRERRILVQRVFDTGAAPIQDGELPLANRLNKNQGHVQAVNGQPEGTLYFEMEAGAVERWRVLNGSVDGQGYIRFLVAPATAPPPNTPVSLEGLPKSQQIATNLAIAAQYNQEVAAWGETHGQPIWNMAFDGVTLVDAAGKYTARQVHSVALAPANRADFLFQAPQQEGLYVLWGVGENHRAGAQAPDPIQIALLNVVGRSSGAPPSPLAPDYFANLLAEVPVPAYLQPIQATDLQRTPNNGPYRTRQVVYAGWGDGGYLCENQQTAQSIPGGHGYNSMTISGLKYDPLLAVQKMQVDTCEEWVLENWSLGKPLYYHAGAVDHPFHMHQNPFWVMAILVPEWSSDDPQTATLTGYRNILDQPRWQDVVPIPHNGGRVIMRARFQDYVGYYVNHCHLLQHEDWGMMQTVEVVADEADANCAWVEAPFNLQQQNYTENYPAPTVEQMWQQCNTFFSLEGDITVGPGGQVSGTKTVTFCPQSDT